MRTHFNNTQLNQKHVLVVDDDCQMADFVADILRFSSNWIVHSATDPKEAYTLATEGGYDLMVADYNMPEWKGDALYDYVSSFRGMVKDTKRPLRLLVISGVPDAEKKFQSLKGVRFLAKPFVFDQLKEKVDELLAD
jgi:CheY-like chemotaxis protein